MSSKISTILLIVLIGLAAIKNTSGQNDFQDQLQALMTSLNEAFIQLNSQVEGAMEKIGELTSQISQLFQTVLNPPKVVSPCGVLENGKQYYIKSRAGSRFVVVDGNKWGLMKLNTQTGAARFTAVEKGCNVYALSLLDGGFMSRCEGCRPRTGDYQTVKFRASDSTQAWSHWTITNKEGTVGGPYNLRSDLSQYFLTFKSIPGAPKEPDQLTLSNVVGDNSWQFIEVPPNCGILQNGDRYYLQSGDGRYAVLDMKNPLPLAIMKNVTIENATPFLATEYACGHYGFCARGRCMSRCESCITPTGDFNSVTFHVSNATGEFSQWAVGSTGRPKPYRYWLNVKDMQNPAGYLSYKLNSNNDFQVTIAEDPTLNTTMFDLIPAVV